MSARMSNNPASPPPLPAMTTDALPTPAHAPPAAGSASADHPCADLPPLTSIDEVGTEADTPELASHEAPFWRAELASHLLMLVLLGIILTHGLVPACFFGMLVYTIVRLAARPIEARLSAGWSRLIALTMIAGLVVTVLVAGVTSAEKALLQADWGALLERLRLSLTTLRSTLPPTLSSALPDDTSDMVSRLAGLAQGNASALSEFGIAGIRASTLCLITGIIASMLAVEGAGMAQGALGAAMGRRIFRLWTAFRKILGAQAKISAINTLLTAVYLLAALPLAGVTLPHSGLLVIVTFFAAFIPVVGNLLSNGAIVVLACTVNLQVAASAVVFLLVIHQFEYFLNARLVGNEVECKAWELLCVMLIGESLFGVSGVIAGPILYSWAKVESKPYFTSRHPFLKKTLQV